MRYEACAMHQLLNIVGLSDGGHSEIYYMYVQYYATVQKNADSFPRKYREVMTQHKKLKASTQSSRKPR